MGKVAVKCLGDGEFRDKCSNPPGAHHSPYFCQRCDNIRMARINQQFVDMAVSCGLEPPLPWVDIPIPDDCPDKRTTLQEG